MNLRRFIPTRSRGRNRANTDLDADEVYRLLSNRRRRVLLLALDARPDEEVSLSELVHEVATEEEYEATRVALYQSHLPVLDEAGVVEWDNDRNLLRSRPPVSALAEVIRHIEQRTGERQR